MQVTSPSLEVAEVIAPAPPIAYPSWAMHPLLFEYPAMLGDEDVGKGASATSGEYH